MEKKIKIKSTSLTPLNETLQKLKLNDTIKDFTPVIVEADGKFTSIVNTKEEFNPNNLGSAIETEEDSGEQKETKQQLLNQAKDALKQTLVNSKELNDILQKIKKLADEDGYNTWELNKEKNSADLKSKNASIFKQNNNLCLSHSGKIELFHSVDELHKWLQDNNYPIPGNDIVIRESVEVDEAKEGRNWVDLLNQYNKNNVTTYIKNDEEVKKKLLDDDTIANYKNKIKEYTDKYIFPLSRINELKAKKTHLSKQAEHSDAILSAVAMKLAVPGNVSENEYKKLLDQKNRLEDIVSDNFETIQQIDNEITDINANLKTPSEEETNQFKTIQKLLSKDYEIKHHNSKARDDLQQGLGKPISKEILQAANHVKPIINPSRKYLQKDTNVEECCGCVGTAALGPAVAYTATPKKKKEKKLQEAIDSFIPGDDTKFPGKREAVNKFLTWYKRNKDLIDSGEIKLPEDFKEKFYKIIEPTFLNNASDSVSRVWPKIILARLETLAARLSEKNNIPKDIVLQNLVDNPNEKICDNLSKELNSYISDSKDNYGKVQLVPGESLLATKDINNLNYQQRQNWQKAYYQSKLNGNTDKTEAMIKTFNQLKDYVTYPNFTAEQRELIKKYNLDSGIKSESSLFESAKNYPWLNKILGQRLTEEDSPADFATGSPLGGNDAGTTTTDTPIDTTSMSTNTPDIDLGDNISSEQPGGFGDINIDAGGYGPEDVENEDMLVPVDMPEYKIIDVLLNDENNDIKVKVQNTDTKEIEVKDLEDIDV